MPSTYHGCMESVITKLAELCNKERDVMLAVVYYIYSASYQATSDRLTIETGEPWGLTRTTEMIDGTLIDVGQTLGNVDWYQASLLDSIGNDLSPFFDRSVKGSIDTVPIRCYHSAHTFQPKYAHDVCKLVVTCSNTGFILQVSKPWAGAMHDNTCLSASEFAKSWREGDSWLADGVFSAGPNIITPYSGPQIWPKKSKNVAAAHEKLQSNQKHAHFRARIEHTFGASLFNRFRLLWKYKGSKLNEVEKVIQSVLNYECLFRHGECGRYAATGNYTTEAIVALNDKFSMHKSMSSRYPQSKKRLTREEEDEMSIADLYLLGKFEEE